MTVFQVNQGHRLKPVATTCRADLMARSAQSGIRAAVSVRPLQSEPAVFDSRPAWFLSDNA